MILQQAYQFSKAIYARVTDQTGLIDVNSFNAIRIMMTIFIISKIAHRVTLSRMPSASQPPCCGSPVCHLEDFEWIAEFRFLIQP